MSTSHLRHGPCAKHKVERCYCGNVLYDCDCNNPVGKFRVTLRVCRCENPAAPTPVRLSTTKKGMVRITWDDVENNMIQEQKYSDHIRNKRHEERQRTLGGRVIYEG